MPAQPQRQLGPAQLSAGTVRPAPRTSSLPPFLYRLFVTCGRPVFGIYFEMRGHGLDHVPRSGAYLLAPNHVSMLDWAFLQYFLPQSARFMIDREFHDRRVIRVGCWLNRSVAVRTERPDVAGLRSAHRLLAQGEPLIVFPEGQISLDGRPQAGRPGVIRLAATAQVPIVPVALRGAFQVFPRWRRVPRPGRITVVFGRPLPPPPRQLTRQRLVEYTGRLMNHITALLDGSDQPLGWQLPGGDVSRACAR